MNHARKKTNGFTIIELMLSMGFVAALLVAIAITTILVSNIYTHGLTLKDVNQAGRAATEDMQRTISSSVPFPISASPGVVSQYEQTASGGRLCAGRFTYVWNLGSALAADAAVYKYVDATPVIFAKVDDPGGTICANPGTAIDKTKSVELLGTSSQQTLVLQSFAISTTPSATDVTTGQTLYAISMKVGTNDRGQLVGNECKPPADGQGNENYCSVNQFDFVVRAGNNAGER